MQLQTVKISKLKSNTGQIEGLPKNPRLIRDEKYAKLKKSIQDDPEMLELREVIAYDNSGELVVICGNMRLKALSDLGYTEVPVKILPQETTVEKLKAYTIKDNTPFGENDWDIIANEWDVDQVTEWGLDLPVDFGDATELEATEDDFEVPEGGIETDIMLGDLFEIGNHRLLCGDSTDSDAVAKLMNGQKADMVFTDPPYGMKLGAEGFDDMPTAKGTTHKSYSNVIGDGSDFTPELINTIFACFPNTKEIFIWGADYFAELLPQKNDGSWVVWDKRQEGGMDNMFGASFELCWSKSKHKREIARILWAGYFGMSQDDTKTRVHPTQKPILLAQWFFNKWGKENDLIADIFLGSGSTMVASEQLKRKCYGMELDPKYCQVIVNRMIKLNPDLIIKKNGEIYIYE